MCIYVCVYIPGLEERAVVLAVRAHCFLLLRQLLFDQHQVLFGG